MTIFPPQFTDGAEDLDAIIGASKRWNLGTADHQQIQVWLDDFDKHLRQAPSHGRAYARAVRRLQALCRKVGRLPSSYLLSDDALHVHATPFSKSGFSDVYNGRLGSVAVAVKALRIHIDSKTKVEKAFLDEAVMWMSLNHPNVVPFLGVSVTIPVSLVSIWMPNGSLTAYLLRYSDVSRVKLLENVTDGLQYIHTLGVVHGDLKAANILVNTDGQACLADFGLATVLHNSGTVTGTYSVKGTVRWMAPELLECEDDGEGAPTFASDVYALGMVFYEVFSGQYPFSEVRNDLVVMRGILNGRRPARPDAEVHGLSNAIWDTVERCWLSSPQQRASLNDVARSLLSDHFTLDNPKYEAEGTNHTGLSNVQYVLPEIPSMVDSRPATPPRSIGPVPGTAPSTAEVPSRSTSTTAPEPHRPDRPSFPRTYTAHGVIMRLKDSIVNFTASFIIDELRYTIAANINPAVALFTASDAILKYTDLDQLKTSWSYSGQIGKRDLRITFQNGAKITAVLDRPVDPATSVTGVGTWTS